MITIKKLRIPIELRHLTASGNQHGITCTTKTDDFSQLVAVMPGPKDSPYECGIFKIGIAITDHYPFRPPIFQFLTPILHPNIDASGKICLDLLRMPPVGSYNPSSTLESLLLSIQLLLATPNPDDPLRVDVADLYKTNYAKFEQQVRELVRKQSLEKRKAALALGEDAEMQGAAEDATSEAPPKRLRML